MDIRQLRYFLTILEQGSLSRAAQALHVAQPALSTHIRNMEAELGTQLLFRSPRGVLPTEAGLVLARHARAVLAQLALAEEEIRGQTAEPEGEVRLGLPATISQLLAVPLISAVHRAHPRIRLRLSEAMSGFVLGWLEEARIDLALLYGEPTSGHIHSQPLIEEELRFLGPPLQVGPDGTPPAPDQPAPALRPALTGGPLPPAGTLIPLAEALAQPLILPGPDHGLRQIIDRAAAAQGLQAAPIFDVDSYSAIKALVTAGLGYAILPEAAVSRQSGEAALQIWPLGAPPLRRRVYLAHAADRPQPQAVRAVQTLAIDVLCDLVRNNQWPGARLLPSA